MFQRIELQKAKSMKSAAEEAQRLRASARSLAERLQAEFDKPKIGGPTGLKFVLHDSGTDVDIESPFGPGRLRLELFVGEREIFGRYLVEKPIGGAMGDVPWEAVWSIAILPHGTYALGDEIDHPFDLQVAMPDGQMELIRNIGLSVLYAMGAGPQLG